MKSKLITSIVFAMLFAVALPLTASARDHGRNYSNQNRPAWAYQHPRWWRYQVKQQNRKWFWEHHAPRGQAYGWWGNRNNRWWGNDDNDSDDHRWNCDEDGDNCRGPGMYRNEYVNPGRNRRYNPNYGYSYGGGNPWAYMLGPVMQGATGAFARPIH